ncbi:hypothetical protein LJC74_05615 [Eubacteriales bacterium OttesenSCG-928-A19]|nr:hypothetical protein [Eubacteriales bacterium OttesenSCG-928-A19]
MTKRHAAYYTFAYINLLTISITQGGFFDALRSSNTINIAPQGLLFNYCRYERSNALEEFQKDYLHELLALQLVEGAKALEEQDTGL